MVDVLSRVTPSMMKEVQEEDVDISKTICYVKSGRKRMLAQISKIKSRPVQRFLWQFDRLVFHQGVLHRVYEQEGAKCHELFLPIKFRAQAMGCFITNKVIRQWNVCYSWYVNDSTGALCSMMLLDRLKIVSGVKLIQIQHRDQLLQIIPWIYYV